ncbi:glycosyltransferase family 4 protein [Mucilaginibacter corticis]|uniref:Glycosyltransferase family 4 protein n=1 Tax=Mucilaginibacter corticis TaxID=2597670 RepID=A0A556MTC4_9SPHI|nr:glycosyltransferase family 4 protein [Mucilaginibacter corticis]TSJ43191.1 glycosyltransferase family 4 protein [Mucilaginibacter corticis]
MVFVSISYNYSPDYTTPEAWLKRTGSYNGLLECLGKTNTVICIKQISYQGKYLHSGIHHHFVNFNSKEPYFSYRINQYVKSLKPDVVLVHGLHVPLQLIHLGLILNKSVKIIVQHHAEKPANGPRKFLQKIADRYVGAYLFASKAMGMEWVSNGNLRSPDKIHEVMEMSSAFYPVDRDIARAKTNIKGERVFLWVGRLDQNKDPLTVIKAFLKFAAINPGAYLYMLYHTEELLPQIKQLLSTTPNSNAIKLIGKIPNEEMLYWYNSADFVVSGSHYEGSGTAVCEAMSCGCVPVITDIFSFRMITNNGNIGLLYPAGNDVQLFDALIQAKKLDLQKERAKALAYFEANLSFKAIARKIQDIATSL